jgi:hypothetical protein
VKSPYQAYPLAWPDGWKRTPSHERKSAQFGKTETRYRNDNTAYTDKRQLSISDGAARALGELDRMGVPNDDVVISTNARPRLDGLPRSDENPKDPGAAVYWRDGLFPRVIAIDRYDRLADNLGAIAATLEAMRAIERHGGAKILERAFTGFTALPAPDQVTGRGWREVLGIEEGVEATQELITQRYRLLRSANHPERGGSNDAFHEVQKAYEQACAAVREK